MKNVAVWGYWTGVENYGVGTKRSGAPWFEALTGKFSTCHPFYSHFTFIYPFPDESGWAWFIPLHNGSTSVGIVVNQKVYNAKADSLPPSPFDQTQASTSADTSALAVRYLSNLNFAPGVVRLIGQGKLVEGSVKTASDFSYSAPSYAGPSYRIVGDAGGKYDHR